MTIEELAFKDRKSLMKLNESDLLDIIEFLQKDRKQWINQFTQTHNESIDIQKENQELKKQLEERTKMYLNAYKYAQGMENEVITLNTQQKEFIKWLENEKISPVKCVLNSIGDKNHDYNVFKNKLDTLEEILQKYKSIIGVEDENN